MENKTIESMRQHYTNEVNRVIEEFYKVRALVFVPDIYIEHCLRLLGENGFYDMLDHDYDLINSLAKLTLTSSLEPIKETIAKALEKDGVQLSELLGRLKRYQQESGFPFVDDFGTDKILLCHI
jgi:hypothetical protein